MRFRGIGRWSAEYALLRGLRRLDVFPSGDVGVRSNLGAPAPSERVRSTTPPLTAAQPRQAFANPLCFHLLLANVADRGEAHGTGGVIVGEALKAL